MLSGLSSASATDCIERTTPSRRKNCSWSCSHSSRTVCSRRSLHDLLFMRRFSVVLTRGLLQQQLTSGPSLLAVYLTPASNNHYTANWWMWNSHEIITQCSLNKSIGRVQQGIHWAEARASYHVMPVKMISLKLIPCLHTITCIEHLKLDPLYITKRLCTVYLASLYCAEYFNKAIHWQIKH